MEAKSNSPSKNKTSEIKLRVSPEIKQLLEEQAKSRNTTLNNVGVLLFNEFFHKKPGLLATLSPDKTFKPGLHENLLEKYRQLVDIYAEMRLSYCLTNYLPPDSCDSFMNALTEFIEYLGEA